MKQYSIIFFILGTFFFASQAKAARIIFEPHPIGQNRYSVDVLLDPQKDVLNGIEGEIVVSGGSSESAVIKTSVVPLWVEAPQVAGNTVKWAGLFPGGFEGVLSTNYSGTRPGLLFSIILSTGKEKIDLNTNNVSIFLNDGAGTRLAIPLAHLGFLPTGGAPTYGSEEDNIKPEPFYPLIGRDVSIESGKWFLVFQTVDNGSGVDHYEVMELKGTKNGEWVVAESPYILRDQSRRSSIYVRAIDKSGNIRMAHLDPLYKSGVWNTISQYVTIIIVVLAAFFGWMISHRR